MKFQSTLLQHSSTDILVNTLRRIRNPRTYRRGYACGLKENPPLGRALKLVNPSIVQNNHSNINRLLFICF
tara:strand:+ start:11 stop:223 length:213 start_codon:yes stop_codon:yes gene_type:complete